MLVVGTEFCSSSSFFLLLNNFYLPWDFTSLAFLLKKIFFRLVSFSYKWTLPVL